MKLMLLHTMLWTTVNFWLSLLIFKVFFCFLLNYNLLSSGALCKCCRSRQICLPFWSTGTYMSDYILLVLNLICNLCMILAVLSRIWGMWDKGLPEIKNCLVTHICNTVCTALVMGVVGKPIQAESYAGHTKITKWYCHTQVLDIAAICT